LWLFRAVSAAVISLNVFVDGSGGSGGRCRDDVRRGI